MLKWANLGQQQDETGLQVERGMSSGVPWEDPRVIIKLRKMLLQHKEEEGEEEQQS